MITALVVFWFVVIVAVCGWAFWLAWYHDTYNEEFFVARRRGTLWKFRSTQFHP